MKNRWFDETFLPSLFERSGGTRKCWLSEKQTDCFCRQRGVEFRQLTRQNSINGGFYVFGSVYTYQWNGRTVSVFPHKNGKSEIYFGNTVEEKEVLIQEEQKKRIEKSFESAKRMKEKRPEKFIEKLQKATDYLILCIKLLDATAASENDEELEDAVFELNEAEIRYYKYYFS